MHSLTIVFGTSTPVMWTLLFQEEGNAKVAFKAILDAKNIGHDRIELADDFSQKVAIETAAINGFMIEDMDKSQLGQLEKAMHDRRGAVKMEQLVNSDPSLRQTVRQPTMPILQPMGNGFRPVS
jgi:hypothetical protein